MSPVLHLVSSVALSLVSPMLVQQPHSPTKTGDSQFTAIGNLGSVTLMVGSEHQDGPELWRSDGTANGTFPLGDFTVGTGAIGVQGFAVVGDKAYFGSGSMLYATDGSVAGTNVVASASDIESKAWMLGTIGEYIIFASLGETNSLFSCSADGANCVALAFSPLGLQAAIQGPIFQVGTGRVVFAPDSYSIWATDGTASGTFRAVGDGNGDYVASLLQIFGDDVFYSDKSNDLRVVGNSPSDVPASLGNCSTRWNGVGSSATTAFFGCASSLYATAGSSSALLLNASGGEAGESAFAGNKLVFAGYDAAHGSEIWVTDGTFAGTVLLDDILAGTGSSNPQKFFASGGFVWFSADSGNLYKTDGTTVTPVNLTATLIAYTSDFLIYLTGSGASAQLHMTNGSTTFDGPTGLSVSSNFLFEFGPSWRNSDGSTFVGLNDGVHGNEPWRITANSAQLLFDVERGLIDGIWVGATTSKVIWSTIDDAGTTPGTLWSANTDASSPLNIATLYVQSPQAASLGNYVVFAAVDAGGELEMWTTDGTTSGTEPLTALNTKGSSAKAIGYTTTVGNRAFFRTGTEGAALWATDGTKAGTVMLIDGTTTSLYLDEDSPMFTAANKVYFCANDAAHGDELWASDGTLAGTELLADAFPGTADGCINEFVENEVGAVGPNVLFAAQTASGVQTLFFTDGTSAGTVSGPNLTASFGLHPSAFPIVFPANDGIHGIEPWITDGTPSGTKLIKDIDSGSASSLTIGDSSIVMAGARAFFMADDGVHGSELWSSDGTEAGTSLLIDLTPGSASSYSNLDFMVPFNGHLLAGFTNRGTTPCTFLLSDGTANGTVSLFDCSEFSGDQNPQNALSGDLLYFVLKDYFGTGHLFRSDGTKSGTFEVATNVNEAIAPTGFGQHWLLFSGGTPATGAELWVTNGTVAHTLPVADLAPGFGASSPNGFQAAQGETFFFADNAGIGAASLYALHATDLLSPPSANAGGAQALLAPAALTLDGSKSADSDGTIVSYTWTQTAGANAPLTNSNSVKATAAGLAVGSYTFALAVVDNDGLSSTDSATITVTAPPTSPGSPSSPSTTSARKSGCGCHSESREAPFFPLALILWTLTRRRRRSDL